MMRDVLAFLRAIWRDWVARMSGVASVILGVLSATLKEVPTWSFWLAAAICLLIASFRVWRTEHRKVFDQEKCKMAKSTVDSWIKSGLALRERIIVSPGSQSPMESPPTPELEAELGDWIQSINSKIDQEFPWFGGQFMNDAGLTFDSPKSIKGKHQGFSDLLRSVEYRLSRLGELLKEQRISVIQS
jgi:hypothetical protein